MACTDRLTFFADTFKILPAGDTRQGDCHALWIYSVYLTLLFLLLTVITAMPAQDKSISAINRNS